MQAAGNRDGATQAHIQLGEFAGGEFGGGVYRGAGFGDDDLGELGLRWQQFDEIGGEAVGIAAGGAVTDGDELHVVLGDECGQRAQGAFPVAARFVWVDRGGIQKLAGGVHHRDLHAGADAGVQPHRGMRAGRCGEQQILEVFRENADGFFFGALTQLAEQIDFHGHGELDAPGPAGGVGEPLVCGAAEILDAAGDHDLAFAGVGLGRA